MSIRAHQTADVAASRGDRDGRQEAKGKGDHKAPRERILAAAEDCFARSGFARTSMDEIAVCAGTAVGNLYRYFPSKSAIVVHLAQQILDEIEAELDGVTSLADFLAALEQMMLAQLSSRRAALLMEIWTEASRNEAMRQICCGMEERLRRNLRRILTAPGQQVRDQQRSELVVRAIASLTGGLIKRRAVEEDLEPAAEIADMMRLIRCITE